MMNGILLNDLDNVVTVTGDISTGEAVCYIRGGKTCKITAVEHIPQFHKISVTDIEKGSDVMKYGERIGYATKNISQGQHVHTHNVDNQ